MLGLLGLTAVWVAGQFFIERLDLQEYFRWYGVHYWVEGVWEVIHLSLVGFLVVLMFGANIKSVGYAVFWGIALVWLSGLLGNAHHYFWIGTPEFWQFWGSLFSALEPLPMIFCFWHIYIDAHQERKPIANKPAFAFLLGSAVLELVGAGILGFTMTFALTNVWSHGTWITAAHGHLALFGTFGMLGLSAAYYAVPLMRGNRGFDQRIGMLAFWLVLTGMLGLGFAFAVGGSLQVFVYRTLGLDWFGGDVSRAMQLGKFLLPLFGLTFIIGVALLVFDLLTMGYRASPEDTGAESGAAPGGVVTGGTTSVAPAGWRRLLTGWEAGLWLLGMLVFGAVITLGLLSFNLSGVRDGNPFLPYLMASIGYPGLFLITLLFIRRFLRSMEVRPALPPRVRADRGPVAEPAE